MNPDSSPNKIQIDQAIASAQLAALASLRRGLGIVVTSFLIYVGFALLILPKLNVPDYIYAPSIFMALIVAFFALRQLQWSVLASHQLRCPYCRHALAADRKWWSSPSPLCKACGKLAILPVAVLKAAAAT